MHYNIEKSLLESYAVMKHLYYNYYMYLYYKLGDL